MTLPDATFPALWFFVLGFVLALGVFRAHRERHDVRDDWNRLMRLHAALSRIEVTGGRDGEALLELRALAEALDESIPPPRGRPELSAQVAHVTPDRVSDAELRATLSGLRQDVFAADATLQARMKRHAHSQGHAGRLFLAGVGGVLLVPLETAGALGLVRRYFARKVERSLWFHGALAIVLFVLLAGTVLATIEASRVLSRALEAH